MTTDNTDPAGLSSYPERTVQVPVSLIEEAMRSLDLDAARPGLVDDLDALLSQPTPTAEPPMCGAISALTNDPCVEDADHNGRHMSIRGFSWKPLAQWEAPSEPPRIEDMAPGTTFSAERVQGGTRLRYEVLPVGILVRWYDDIRRQQSPMWAEGEFDPSTIRDVTPPKERL